MIRYFAPHYRFQKLTDIPPDFFSGASGIIFDVDNTLVAPESTTSKPATLQWFAGIKSRYRVVCTSNSQSIKKRHPALSGLLECPIFLSWHKKPSPQLFHAIVKEYDFKPGKIVVVGDRVFTDVVFANMNGATSVLVAPLTPHDPWFIAPVRRIESIFLFLLDKINYTKSR